MNVGQHKLVQKWPKQNYRVFKSGSNGRECNLAKISGSMRLACGVSTFCPGSSTMSWPAHSYMHTFSRPALAKRSRSCELFSEVPCFGILLETARALRQDHVLFSIVCKQQIMRASAKQEQNRCALESSAFIYCVDRVSASKFE